MCGVSTTLSIVGQRVPDRQVLAVEVIEAGAAEVARLQRGDQRVEVVQAGASRVQVEGAVAHRRELIGPHHAERLGRRRGVHRHDVGLGQHRFERVVGRLGRVRVERDDVHPEPLEAPAGGTPHCAQSHQADGAPGHLPGAVALVGDGTVDEDLVGPHVAVARQQVAGHGEQQRHRQLGHAVGVAARGAQHRVCPWRWRRRRRRWSDRRASSR